MRAVGGVGLAGRPNGQDMRAGDREPSSSGRLLWSLIEVGDPLRRQCSMALRPPEGRFRGRERWYGNRGTRVPGHRMGSGMMSGDVEDPGKPCHPWARRRGPRVKQTTSHERCCEGGADCAAEIPETSAHRMGMGRMAPLGEDAVGPGAEEPMTANGDAHVISNPHICIAWHAHSDGCRRPISKRFVCP